MLGLLGALQKICPEDETVTIPYVMTPLLCSHQDNGDTKSSKECDERDGIISFGSNVYGRLGVLDEMHQAVPNGLVRVPRTVGIKFGVGQVACGAAHMLCCVDGKCYSWGKCHFSQLGLGSEWMNCYSPTLIPQHTFIHNHHDRVSENQDKIVLNDHHIVYVKSVGCGESHSMIVTSKGELFTFGCGYSGALGHGSEAHELYPRKVLFETHDDINPTLSSSSVHVMHATGGKCHTIISSKDGTVWTFGKNDKGQLGLGIELVGFSQFTPKRVVFPHLTPSDVVDTTYSINVCASRGGDMSGCIFNNQLYLWGDNQNQCILQNIKGDGCAAQGHADEVALPIIVASPTLMKIPINSRKDDNNHRKLKVTEAQLEGIHQVSMGSKHIVVLTTNGKLYSWGQKGSWLGQYIPTPTKASSSSTTAIPPSPSPCLVSLYNSHNNIDYDEVPIHISCGEQHSVVVTDRGHVYTCGSSYMNKLGEREADLEQACDEVGCNRNSSFRKVVGLKDGVEFALWSLAGSNHTSLIVSSSPSPLPLSPSPPPPPPSSPPSSSSSSLPSSSPIQAIMTPERFHSEALVLEQATYQSGQMWKFHHHSNSRHPAYGYLSIAKPYIRTMQRASSSTPPPDSCQRDELARDLEELDLFDDDATLIIKDVAYDIVNDNNDIAKNKDVGSASGLDSESSTTAWKCSIVFSETWNVPVLYFNVFNISDTAVVKRADFNQDSNSSLFSTESLVPLTWREIEPLMEAGLRNSSSGHDGGSLWPVISHEIHPITGEPSYMLHPCHTAERMSSLLHSGPEQERYAESGPIHYLSAWINLIGNAIGLYLSPEAFVKIQQAHTQS